MEKIHTSSIFSRISSIVKYFTRRGVLFAFVFVLLFGSLPQPAEASTLVLSPATGTFIVGSTFTVTVLLNTENDAVNTVGTLLTYPADKLQLVSPSTGNSIISIWTTLPKVDNMRGIVELQGGIPGGIKTSNAAVTTLTFRVNSVGTGVIKFGESSKVLLHDGHGTDSLRQVTNGVYSLVLPPPAGPIVSSETHPDQSKWYANPTVVLRWAPDQTVDGYSFSLSDNPTDEPDDISQGLKQSVTYKNLNDGVHFFHIKSLKDGAWGGTTHFAIKIDSTAPAQFPVEILPSARTSNKTPIAQFSSTDAASGINHYEIKIVPLTPSANGFSQTLFIEATSPYVLPELNLGNYDVIVRAYDEAGNYREVSKRLSIVNALFTIVQNEGLRIGGVVTMPWLWLWIIILMALVCTALIAWRVRSWHHGILHLRHKGDLPDKIQNDLEELNKFRKKYGKLACLLIVCVLFFAQATHAETLSNTPPIIDSISNEITNEDIFYVSGKTDAAGATVIIYIQNLTTGETVTEQVEADNRGDWFYRHNGFLNSGNYLLWTQSKIGNEVSPPGPQERIVVRTSALHVGTSRLSLESIYLSVMILALVILLGLIVYTLYHARRGKFHARELEKEIRQAEESIRRGFALLRRDIQEELSLVHKAKMEKELSDEEKIKEEQLLKDLEVAEQTIGSEIWRIDHLESEKT